MEQGVRVVTSNRAASDIINGVVFGVHPILTVGDVKVRVSELVSEETARHFCSNPASFAIYTGGDDDIVDAAVEAVRRTKSAAATKAVDTQRQRLEESSAAQRRLQAENVSLRMHIEALQKNATVNSNPELLAAKTDLEERIRVLQEASEAQASTTTTNLTAAGVRIEQLERLLDDARASASTTTSDLAVARQQVTSLQTRVEELQADLETATKPTSEVKEATKEEKKAEKAANK